MQKITFHKFGIGDPDDPEMYATFPMYEFMQTEKGQWIRANCADPQYIIKEDISTFGQQVVIYGEVPDPAATEYYLKWG